MPSIKILKERIESILDILHDFKNLREIEHSRSKYIIQLCEDFCTYYGYNIELIHILNDIFNPDELKSFLDATENERPITIRTNTLLTKRKCLIKLLKNKGIKLNPINNWSSVGINISDTQMSISSTPEYLSGYYIIQNPSSFLPVMALNPKPNERVLDMCAAPGGKTTHIAQRMKNTGLLIANDISKYRLYSVTSNLHRLGVSNTIVINFNGIKLSKHYSSFNKILLDAPCTGLGIISKDQSIKKTRTFKDLYKLSKLQKELILSGIDMLEEKTGTATIVYSTCSISVHENEDVIAYALKKRYVRLDETSIPFGKKGFNRFKNKCYPSCLTKTRRYYPHVHNMDGFFIAKLIKFKGGIRVNND
jgi:ribosomal RNA methyltransferase Nop2